MDAQQIRDIESRCKDVINGFKRPSEQDPRNALKLLQFIEQLRQQRAAEAFSNIGKVSGTGGLNSAFDKVMDDIFGKARG